MKHSIFALSILALCAAAHATDPKPTSTASANSSSGASAGAIAVQGQAQRQRQEVKNTVSNTVTVTPAPIKVRVSVAAPTAVASVAEPKAIATEQPPKDVAADKTDAVIVTPRDERPVSTAYAPSINPTSPCALTVSGGMQIKEIGLSFGGTPIAPFCETIELAKAAYSRQDVATGDEIMCNEDKYRKARMRAKRPCAEDLQAADGKRAEQILSGQPVASLELLP